MASSLRLIASNLFTMSFRPPCFLSIYARHRSYAAQPKYDFYDQSRVKNMSPKISLMSFGMHMTTHNRGLSLNMPGGFLYLQILEPERDDNTWLIQGKAHKECCLTSVKLPDMTGSDIKEEMKDGTLAPPNEEDSKANAMANILANDIISSFRDITATRSWLYYDMFLDRSILGEGFCPLIAMMSHIHSFSIYKKETAERLWIAITMPGLEKMKLTTQGLRVSLNMRSKNDSDNIIGPKRENVKTFFDYDTFFIEAKTKEEHYITGIHLPEGIQKKHHMIKREMKHGVFNAFLPCVKKKEIKIN